MPSSMANDQDSSPATDPQYRIQLQAAEARGIQALSELADAWARRGPYVHEAADALVRAALRALPEHREELSAWARRLEGQTGPLADWVKAGVWTGLKES